jgi:hypothetical protein
MEFSNPLLSLPGRNICLSTLFLRILSVLTSLHLLVVVSYRVEEIVILFTQSILKWMVQSIPQV